MYDLEDIDEEYPELLLGTEYSDLYKDIYGRYPSGLSWPSIQDFKFDLDELRDMPHDDIDIDEEEDDYTTISIDDYHREESIMDQVGYDRRMNRYETEWDE